MKTREKPSYFAVIPADVRYDKNLKAIERLLYGEITCLSQKTGYCFATNQYFAELYGTTTRSISSRIRSLKNNGYIDIDENNESGNFSKRIIKLVSDDTIKFSAGIMDNSNIKEENSSKKVFKGNPIENRKTVEKENKEINKKVNLDDKIKEMSKSLGFSDELANIIIDLKEDRLERKLPMTERAIKIVLNKLKGYSESDCIDSISKTIENGWRGVFMDNYKKNGSDSERILNFCLNTDWESIKPSQILTWQADENKFKVELKSYNLRIFFGQNKEAYGKIREEYGIEK